MEAVAETYKKLTTKLSKHATNVEILGEDGYWNIYISASNSSHSIEIEDNPDWITLRTNFYFIDEHSVSKRTNKAELREQLIDLAVNMIKFGCEERKTYKADKLLSTKFYVDGKSEGSVIISGISFLGKKNVKTRFYKFT